MITPLQKPHSTATARHASTVRPKGVSVRVCKRAITMQLRPATAPPEISIPPVMMITVCATAITPTMEPCLVRLVRL